MPDAIHSQKLTGKGCKDVGKFYKKANDILHVTQIFETQKFAYDVHQVEAVSALMIIFLVKLAAPH